MANQGRLARRILEASGNRTTPPVALVSRRTIQDRYLVLLQPHPHLSGKPSQLRLEASALVEVSSVQNLPLGARLVAQPLPLSQQPEVSSVLRGTLVGLALVPQTLEQVSVAGTACLAIPITRTTNNRSHSPLAAPRQRLVHQVDLGLLPVVLVLTTTPPIPEEASLDSQPRTTAIPSVNSNNRRQTRTPSVVAASGNRHNSQSTGFGATNNANGANAGGGLFGNTQPANTGGGLFGNTNNTQQQQNAGGPFGVQNNNNQNSGSSLFGTKPAAPAGGLFGNTAATNTTTGGGLFGVGFGNTNNQQPQQNQGSSLFGNANNQQKPGGLFGNTGSNTGGSLFGNTNNNQQQSGGSFGSGNQQPQQQQTSSLFGNTNNNNQGPSLFGSQQQPAQQNAFQQPQTLQTSILDPNAFGSPSIFSGLPPPPQVTGPIATPISARKLMKKSAILPHYKMTPSGSSRFQTPQRRGGFGFSYSTYGTPGSASSNTSTPGGFNSSLYSSSVGRGLGKSLSTSNLRRNFDDAESVLTPGAFSAGSSRYDGSSNLKRLTIDRSLRTDLFTGAKDGSGALPSPEKERQPSILKKKVSFDASTVGGKGEQQNGGPINGSIENEQPEPTDR